MHRRLGLSVDIGVQNVQVIADILKHGTPFVVCLFPVVNGALFVQRN